MSKRKIPGNTEIYREWSAGALILFQRVMPPINIPYPEIRLCSSDTYEKERASLVTVTGSPAGELPSEEAMLEYIHGDNGYAVLVRLDLIPHGKGEPYDSEFFMHAVWHELAHFYVINTDPNGIYHLYGEMWSDENRNRKRGYFFWEEFVAECIANYIGFRIRSAGPGYRPDQMVWMPDLWAPISDMVAENLDLIHVEQDNGLLDEYGIAYYYASFLTDDTIQSYAQAARTGNLIGPDGSPYTEDPTHIEDEEDAMQPILEELLDLLDAHVLNHRLQIVGQEVPELLDFKENFWVIDEETLEEIGELIFRLDEAEQGIWGDEDDEDE